MRWAINQARDLVHLRVARGVCGRRAHCPNNLGRANRPSFWRIHMGRPAEKSPIPMCSSVIVLCVAQFRTPGLSFYYWTSAPLFLLIRPPFILSPALRACMDADGGARPKAHTRRQRRRLRSGGRTSNNRLLLASVLPNAIAVASPLSLITAFNPRPHWCDITTHIHRGGRRTRPLVRSIDGHVHGPFCRGWA